MNTNSTSSERSFAYVVMAALLGLALLAGALLFKRPAPKRAPSAPRTAASAAVEAPSHPVVTHPLIRDFDPQGPPPKLTAAEVVELGALGEPSHPLLIRSLLNGIDTQTYLTLLVLQTTGGVEALTDSIERDLSQHALLVLRARTVLTQVVGARRVVRWTARLLDDTATHPGLGNVRFSPDSKWGKQIADHAARSLSSQLEALGLGEAAAEGVAASPNAPTKAKALAAWWSASGAALSKEIPGPSALIVTWHSGSPPADFTLDGDPLSPALMDPFLREWSEQLQSYAVHHPLEPGSHTICGVEVRTEPGFAPIVYMKEGSAPRLETDPLSFWEQLSESLRGR